MRDWQSVVNGLSDVQKLVHLSMRLTEYDADRIRGEIVKVRRRAYEHELGLLAQQVGCPGRTGRLTGGPALSELNEMSRGDAGSITATYNFDLAQAIAGIGVDTPRANRNTYAKRLGEWEAKRTAWKAPQIAQYSEGTARGLAQRDFRQFNDTRGYAELQPRDAVCPVCQGWITRGKVNLDEALRNPPPYHPNCPHGWDVRADKVSPDECPLLWMGEG